MVAVTWVSAKTNTRSMNNLRGGGGGRSASFGSARTRPTCGRGHEDRSGCWLVGRSRLRPGASAGPRRHRPAPVEGADPPPNWAGEPRLMPPENYAGTTGGRLPTVRGRDDAAQAD